MDTTIGWLPEDADVGSYHDLRDEVAPSFLDDSTVSSSPELTGPHCGRRRSSRLLAKGVHTNLPDSPLCTNSPGRVAATPLCTHSIATASKNLPCSPSHPPISISRVASHVRATPQFSARGSRLPMSDAKARGITFSLFKTPPKTSLGLTCRPVGAAAGQDEKVLRRLSFSKLLTNKIDVDDSSKENMAAEDENAEDGEMSGALFLSAVTPSKPVATPANKLRRTASSCLSTSRQKWQESRRLKTPSKPNQAAASHRAAAQASDHVSSLSASVASFSVGKKSASLSRTSFVRCATPSSSMIESKHTSKTNLKRSASTLGGRSRPTASHSAAANVKLSQGRAVDSSVPLTVSGRCSDAKRPGSAQGLHLPTKRVAKSPPHQVSPKAKRSKVKAASRASLFCAQLR